MTTNIIFYAILLVAAIGAIVGWSNSKKGAAWGQPMTIVCAIVAICMGLYLAYRNSSGSAANAAAMQRENAYRTAKVTILGEKVKEICAGKKPVVIIDPNVDVATDVEIQLWKELFGLSDADFLAPEPPQPPAGTPPEMVMMEPMDQWFTVKMLEKMLGSTKPELVIFTTSMPRGLKHNKGKITNPCLKDAKIVLASGNLYGVAGFLNAGTVVAAVTSSPKAVYDDKPAPKDIKKAFDKRYVLITEDNFQDFYKQNKEMFGL